jgi:hypothetical protein
MENKICVLTEASDSQIHLTRTAIYSFLETNKWFDGTIYLAVRSDSPLSGKNVAMISSIYSNISIVSSQSNPIFEYISSQKKYNFHSDILTSCLKTLVFGLPESRVLYFSNTSLFLKDISYVLRPNSIVSADSSLSLIYTSLLDNSDIFLSIVENIKMLSSLSKDKIDSAIFSAIADSSEHIQEALGFYQSSYFSNKKFNQLKPQLNHAKYLSFDSMSSNRLDASKINSVWIQKNQQVANFLNKPSLSSAAALKSIKSQLAIKNNTSAQYSANRHSIQKLNDMLGHKVFIERAEIIKNLSNKSICVVANSSDLLEYNYGAFIDSHDIVVRFNGYKIIPEKTGIKTSLHCVFREYHGKHDPAAPIKLIISKSRSQWTNSIASFHAKDAIYRNYQIIDFNYPSNHDMKRANCDNLSIPTSGICLYTYLVSLGLRDNIRLVGFNGYNGGDPTTILRENDDLVLAGAHNYEIESQFWSSQFVNILPGVLKSK